MLQQITLQQITCTAINNTLINQYTTNQLSYCSPSTNSTAINKYCNCKTNKKYGTSSMAEWIMHWNHNCEVIWVQLFAQAVTDKLSYPSPSPLGGGLCV